MRHQGHKTVDEGSPPKGQQRHARPSRHTSRKAAVQMEFPDFPQFHMRARIRMRHQGSPKQLTRTARPSRHTYSSKAAVQMEFPEIFHSSMRARFRMRHQGSPKQLTRVGFEPTPPKGLVPKTSALDRSAISPYILVEGSSSNGIPRFSTVPHACQNSHEAPGLTKTVDESGIRTHAPEGTGALNQRLGPLGHLATSQFRKAAVQMEFPDFPQFHMRARFRMRHQGSPKQLTRTARPSRHTYSIPEGSSSNGIPRFSTVPHACQNSHEAPGLTKTVDEEGIRTHAPEGTGALNQRLGPLGHLATSQFRKAAVQMEFPDFPQFPMRARFRMRHQVSPKQLTRVGFEPTPPKGLVPKTSALDRSAISPYILVEGSSSNGIPRFSTVPHACQNSHEAPGLTKTVDESGIRTHAPRTGALNQRLRPLGHLAIHTQFRKAAVQMEFPDFPQFHMRARFRMRHQGSPKQLTRVGFEPTPPKGLVP
ncbi:hypothetical protein RB195_015985 [Necator americanus]|uniref:Uncharacterized protein n=1 Tax=Necator americanus TaxID=51031 RepID=A0ABR1E718_NECAM